MLDEDKALMFPVYAEKTDISPEELVGKNHFELFPKSAIANRGKEE
ncbi:MAG: hypothetical protein V5A66_04395 [Candidatus Thermoplasmatota archaeon]